MHGPEGRAGFRPDIEGLRAVAVLAVVLYHAGVPGLAGGFVGVDVFFVISGFLITGLLWQDVADSGRIRFARFYGARARRVLPAAVAVLLTTALASAWWLPPLQARTVLGDALASALFTGNYRLALRGTDYLAASGSPSPFDHYWTLGVEEQFYLLWPVLLVVVSWVARDRRRSHVVVVAGVSAVAITSFVLAQWWTGTVPSWAFFSLPSRAWELATGGLVALTVPWWRRLPPSVAGPAGWAGLAVILVSCMRLGATTPYPGVAALAPVAGAALVAAAGCAQSPRAVTVLLRVPPLRAVGRLSYSWYLWHWPVLVLAPAVIGGNLSLTARLGAVAVSAALAGFTLVVLENPVRFATPLRRSTRRSLVLAAGVTATAVSATLALLAVIPTPVGRGAAISTGPVQAAPTTAASPTAGETSPPPPPPSRAQALAEQVNDVVAESARTREVPSNLTPPLSDAADDLADPFRNGCMLTWGASQQDACAYGRTTSPTTVDLIGDSHATQWFPAVDQVARQHRWRLQVWTKATCPPVELPITSPVLGREYTECERWRSMVLDRIRAEHPALVILGMARHYDAQYGFTVYSPEWLAGLTRMEADIRAAGSAVAVMGAIPKPPTNVPTCLSANLASATECTFASSSTVDLAGIAAEKAATAASGGHYVDVVPLFCAGGRCPVIVGNRLVYRDDNHVTTSYAAWLAPAIGADIDAIMSTE